MTAGYWVRAAREQSRWAVGLTAEYRASSHAKKRARLWQERVGLLLGAYRDDPRVFVLQPG